MKSYVEPGDTVFTANDKFNVSEFVKPAVKAVEFINNVNIKNEGSLGKKTREFNQEQADRVIEIGKKAQKLGRDLGLLDQPEIKK